MRWSSIENSVTRLALPMVATAALTVVALAGTSQAGPDWTVTDSPNPGGRTVTARQMWSVVAVSDSHAWAVGSYNGLQPMAVRWDGKSWRKDTTLIPPDGVGELYSVDASGESNVWAAGSGYNRPWVVRYDGVEWQSVAKRELPRTFSPRAIAVRSKRSVVVGGTLAKRGRDVPAVASWNGSGWSIDNLPVRTKVRSTVVRSITPIPGTKRFIVAGGYYTSGIQKPYLVTGRANRWRRMPMAAEVEGYATDVVAFSSGRARMVGGRVSGGDVRSLIQRWNGKSWIIEPSPNRGGSATLLSGIAASSRRDLMAVGSTRQCDQERCIERTMAMRYLDGSWTFISSPNPSLGKKSDEFVDAVHIPDTKRYWAVGSHGRDNLSGAGLKYTLIARSR